MDPVAAANEEHDAEEVEAVEAAVIVPFLAAEARPNQRVISDAEEDESSVRSLVPPGKAPEETLNNVDVQNEESGEIEETDVQNEGIENNQHQFSVKGGEEIEHEAVQVQVNPVRETPPRNVLHHGPFQYHPPHLAHYPPPHYHHAQPPFAHPAFFPPPGSSYSMHPSSAFQHSDTNQDGSGSNKMNSNEVAAMAQAYHEQAARMRDHAAAYANAAAGAAWAAAQIATVAAEFASSAGAGYYSHNNGVDDDKTSPNDGQSLKSMPPCARPLQNTAATMSHQNSQFPPTNNMLGPMQFQHNHPPMMLPPPPPPPPPPHSMLSPHQYAQPPQPSIHSLPFAAIPGPGGWWPNYGSTDNFNSMDLENFDPHGPNTSARGEGMVGEEPFRRKNNYNKFASRSSGSYHRHRRKRQQRLPPDDSSVPREIVKPIIPQQQQRGKVRRRLRSDNDSSTTSSGSSFMPYSNSNGSPSSRRKSGHHHNKKKARSDESLLGKTGVAALYEWCSKRHITPNFVLQQPSPEEFDYIVFLDGTVRDATGEGLEDDDGVTNEKSLSAKPTALKEWGRGRGRTKVAAKQEAARRALQALIPNVVFDDESGILIELPPSPVVREKFKKNSLDELAPNLAKQLAIGRDTNDESTPKLQQQSKRTLDIYPGTSTTSEEEDENTYYASRGASVCSVLLHAMIQIDPVRIPEGPSFTYEISPAHIPRNGQHEGQIRRKVSSGRPLPAVRATRGSFSCTAKLKVRDLAQPCEDSKIEASSNPQSNDNNTDFCPEEDSSKVHESSAFVEVNQSSAEREERILEAVGVGGTKREARHVASAKLLALLFPECHDMVEVKAAAEAMREKYAASKALKQQAAQSTARRRDQDSLFLPRNKKGERALCLYAAKVSDPPMPAEIQRRFRQLLGFSESTVEDITREGESLSLKSYAPKSEASNDSSVAAFRQFSRQKQIDSTVDRALQLLNDRDEEGRSLPEELTADDVGRLVLRRAEPEDLARIKRLNFVSTRNRSEATLLTTLNNECANDTSSLSAEVVSRLWSSSSIVLLLCRAIAAYEDPPLGCAVLTLGFSMEKGCILRLAQIASEPHLPIERFIESLQNFSNCMKCGLETNLLAKQANELRLSKEDIDSIIKSHVDVEEYARKASMIRKDACELGGALFKCAPFKLQSVKEESEVSDSSSNSKRAAKRASKPSKRSRFE